MAEAPKKSASKGWVKCDVKLDGKTTIVTGANQGVGYETALEFARRGARVIMACRNLEKGEAAKAKILEEVKDADVVVNKLDLASFASIYEFAQGINENVARLDILVNNAGIMACPQWKTEEGFEMQFGTNHIGHFLLTNLLLDLLKKSAPSRIIIVSSIGHKFGKMEFENLMHEKDYDPYKCYTASKLANVLHCKELSKRLEGTGVTCNSLHPGAVKSSLIDHTKDATHFSFFQRMLFKVVVPIAEATIYIGTKQGAQTSIYCAIAPELENVTGKYFNKCAEETPSKAARNEEDAKRLWEITEELVKNAKQQCKDDTSEEAKKTDEPTDDCHQTSTVGENKVKDNEKKSEEEPTTEAASANEDEQKEAENVDSSSHDS